VSGEPTRRTVGRSRISVRWRRLAAVGLIALLLGCLGASAFRDGSGQGATPVVRAGNSWLMPPPDGNSWAVPL